MSSIIGSLTGLVFMMIPIVWIIMHYKSKPQRGGGFNQDEARQLEELREIADNMAERVKTLESILDAEIPEWRDYNDQE